MKPDLPDPVSSVLHYDEIPDKCLGDSILDIGSSDGYGAAHSRHRKHFLTCDYLGIDIQGFQRSHLLSIIEVDIFEFKTEKRFDTILMLHVIEHFDIEHWRDLFIKVISLLAPKGFLVVNVPYQEKENKAVSEVMEHKVLGIDERLLLEYLPFQRFIKVRAPTPIIFRSKGESLIWACVRFIARILTHHRHSMIRRYLDSRKPVRIVGIYQKRRR